ncbi:unnamed protein product [Wuchereria bancrofti]|uniref:Nuclear receptor domain-containing protein n=1 Tax=Wuchereria bancrofti TaxID=6293 RepID=A0A3P7F0C2_WUCBA|nr:unnamed protein product [Wuchereria bancrofti]
MSRRHISRTTPNKEEQSSSSFCIPDPTAICSTTGFVPVSNSVPSTFNILNNRGPFAFINNTSNCAPNNNNNNDNRNFLFSTDRFNPSLLQPNVSPYANIINNDPRLHPTSAILPNPLRQHNSMSMNTNETTFDRFLQSFPASQRSSMINPSSVPMISVAPITPTVPATGLTSLLPTATANNSGPSTSSFIPPPLLSDQPSYKYLLSFEQQAKIAHEAAMHYANLTEHLMEHARNAAAAENMPLPPLPQAVFSMVQKYDQQKESLQNHRQQQKKEDEKKDLHPTYLTLGNMVPFSHSDTIMNSDKFDQQQLFKQKRPSLFNCTFSEPVVKSRHAADNVSNTDTTPSGSESDSSNKTTVEILPILSPHPYCAASAENNFEQQQNEMEMDESEKKNTAETVNQPMITPLRTIQERFNKTNSKYKIETDHSSTAIQIPLTPSERFISETTLLMHDNTSRNDSDNVASTSSQSHLDSGISMSANLTDKRGQMSFDKPSWSNSFTVSSILVGNNEEKDEIDALKHIADATAMTQNQPRTPNPKATTNLSVLPYTVPQQTIQNCINQMVQTAGPSNVRTPFKNLPGYAITTNGLLIASDGRAIPPAIYNCFGIPRQPLVSMDPNQEEDNNLCAICGDKASGNHYSVPSCEGCKGFFRRTIQKKIEYICYKQGNCIIDQKNRNRCQSCRFKKCLQLGMRQESVRLDRNRRRKKDENRDKEMEEIEEMKKLKAIVVSAYREAFPAGLVIDNRSEAVQRIHMFLNNIPMMNEINGKDREKVIENCVYAALTLRTFFTTENYEMIVGVRSEALAQCLNGLGFEVKEEEMAILTAFCALQNCIGMVDNEKIQNIGAKLCNCLRIHLTGFCEAVNEIICKCIMSVTALMLMQTNTN